MLVVDGKGRIVYANTPLATLLGYKLPLLRSKDLAALMPPPYDVLHGKWLKVRRRMGRTWGWKCGRQGRALACKLKTMCAGSTGCWGTADISSRCRMLCANTGDR